MINYIKLLRPHQWAKQSIVFIPILSLGESIDIRGLAQGMAAVISFTFIASSVYIINDYFDSGEDRLDPIRKNRPLASGLVSKSLIKLLLLLLL
ncbi:MAG: UbiA family prenyltransferase, partial [Proteobacteria bacterium]|nr:UbiA family prenyltransferase [Pseudomonadota bacterium]